ncbi:MAG: helix-turn-helix domain-containing protein [Lachnospiraceae bacterium]|nr:helix-turn-helix domain-containing protein [Lachnospiraceae bacterium]MCI1328013.1 helix-turn-helix domain-containing protein [Lachnospiraceae bacterium]
MKVSDPGILEKSTVFAMTPTEEASRFLFYPTWCGHYYCTDRYMLDRNSFPYLLVMYIQKGKMHIRYRGEETVALPGDIALLDCTEKHYYRAENNLEFYYLHYDGSNSHELTRHIMERSGWMIRKQNNRIVRDKIANLLDGFGSGQAEAPMSLSLQIYEILELLAEPEENSGSIQALIQQSVAYIREHVGEEISLKTLADEVNLSVYYFSHCFKSVTGRSPMDFVINTRIERAKVLLIRTNRSIEEIAEEVGYATSGSLINLFRKHEGISPNRFRKTYFDH